MSGLLISLWVFALVQYYSPGNSSSYLLILTDMYCAWVALGGAVVLLFSCITAFKHRTIISKLHLVNLGAFAVFTCIQYGFVKLNDHLRYSGLQSAVKTARPLINAIRAYQIDNGEVPPRYLAQLVPKYIGRIPKPRVGAWHYTYVSQPDYANWADLGTKQSTPWLLRIDLMRNLFSQATLAYPEIESTHKQRSSRIGEWTEYVPR